ncbi:MAG: carboxypeptidase regulatory-like domain-containing protein [Bryobacteraceae bacterium]
MLRRTALALLFLSAATFIHGQTTGGIQGVVYDPSGAAVPGASLSVLETATNAERQLSTDARGWYLAPGLAPGVYTVTVSHAGFRGEIRQGLELAAGREVRVDFHLMLGEARGSVTVTAETPLVSVSTGDWGGSVERQKLDELPLNGRDMFDLSAQEPGATIPATAIQTLTVGTGIHVSIHGSRPNQNSFRLDGIYINDWSNSAPASAAGRLLGLEGIEELRVVASPFSAEFGRTAGTVFTAVSRSGSNQLHGGLYEYLRNSALDAKNFFDPAGQKTPPLRRNQFGGLLGGPLRRNELFFFANYEGVREASSVTVNATTLSAAAREGQLSPVAPQVQPYLSLYPLPNGRDLGSGIAEYITDQATHTREDYWVGKVDAIFSGRLRASARYSVDDAHSAKLDPFRIWNFILDSRYQFVHTETHYVQSARTIHSFRAGFSRDWSTQIVPVRPDIPASLSFVKGQQLGTIQVTGLTDLGGYNARLQPRRFVTNDFQFSYDGVYIRGANALRWGAGYDRVQFNQVADLSAVGNYVFYSVSDFLQARPQSGDLMLPGSDTARGWRENQYFVFVQGEFRPTRRVGLTVGVRYETNSVPREVNGKIATLPDPLRDTAVTVGGPLFQNPSRKNFAPRAAIAWDPWGSGKTVLRAGGGIFFDQLGIPQLVIVGNRMPPFYIRVMPVSPSFPDLVAAAAKGTPQKSLDTMDFYENQPYVAQFQFLLERQLNPDSVVRIGYSGSRGLHLGGQIGNINPTAPSMSPDGQIFFPANAPRLNPAFDQIGMRRTQFNSFYHGLLAGMERTWRHGIHLQVNYAWAKSIDDTSNSIWSDFVNSNLMPTIFNYRLNRGLSDFDLRHSLSANFSYQMPRWDRSTPRRVLGGWAVYGLMQAHSGFPFAPTVGFDRARLRGGVNDLGQRPDFAGVSSGDVILGDPQRYFNPLAFGLPAAGFYGNLGRNTLTGPGLVELDAALHRDLWQTERHSLGLRLEFFNVANHPNFQVPSGLALFDSNSQRVATAGRITATTTTSRQIQAALKWTF